MSYKSAPPTVSTIGIDLGKNSFHLVGLDQRGAIVWQLKCSRAQLERRLANIPCCMIGMEACSGAHYIARQLAALGHDVRLMPAQYVKPFLKGHKNDYRDAEAIAEAVQRPTMHFVAIKTPEQMDLLALHRVRSRLVSQRTGVINQIRGFLIERCAPPPETTSKKRSISKLDRAASAMRTETALPGNSEMSSQIIPLKSRVDLRETSRILATETIRV